MSAKELTKLTLTDLWKESNSFEDFWQKEGDAVREFRRIYIEGALEAEREMLIGFKPYERQTEQKRYRNGYWKIWIMLRGGRLEINVME